MILYDKNSNFLGASQDILHFLGYEDIDDFKTYVNDIADLFVKEVGFIYKFDKFSWIHYALHSGAPSKSAILKLKNGKHVKIDLIIEEIYLAPQENKHENQNNMYYAVRIIHNDSSSKEQTKTKKSLSKDTFSDITQNMPFSIDEGDKTSLKSTISITNADSNFKNENLQDETISFLQKYKLPKTKEEAYKDYNKNTFSAHVDTTNTNNHFKNFFEYNDSISIDFSNAILKKETAKINEYIINLKNITTTLNLNTITNKLEDIKAADDKNLQDTFKKYQNAVENLKKNSL